MWASCVKTFLSHLDEKDHPFSEVVIMLPPNVEARDDYHNMTIVPTHAQHRDAPDFLDMCEADVKTEWFMLTNSYHHVANHVDLMFTPGKFQPVIPLLSTFSGQIFFRNKHYKCWGPGAET